MSLKRNNQDSESREFWKFVDRTAQEVSAWPEWKKAGPVVSKHGESQHGGIWIGNFQRHREDGPAIVYTQLDGTKVEYWYKNGLLHREGGPACVTVHPDGSKTEEWYKDGQKIDPPKSP